MKGKLLATALLGMWLVSHNANATIARQAVMGGQPTFTSGATSVFAGGALTNAVNGSLWYDDDYNVFYNPSYIMDYKNYAVVQKGLEGGWFSGVMENFAYGIYLNRGGVDAAAGAVLTGGAAAGPNSVYGGGNFLSPGLNSRGGAYNTGNTGFIGDANDLDSVRPIDFFFGGDTGIKWGFHGTWAYRKNETIATKPDNDGAEVTTKYWHFDLGAQFMGFEPFLGVTAFSNYEDTTKGKKATQRLDEVDVGFRYKYEGWTPYFVFKKYREGGSQEGMLNMAQARVNAFGFGIGHDSKVADGIHVIKNAGLWYTSTEDDTATTVAQRDFKTWILPLNLAIEADATSWLTVRAGTTYHLINTRKFARSSLTSATDVGEKMQSQNGTYQFRVGTTLKFGKLNLDSALGFGNAAADNAGALEGAHAGFDSQTFALLSVKYHW